LDEEELKKAIELSTKDEYERKEKKYNLVNMKKEDMHSPSGNLFSSPSSSLSASSLFSLSKDSFIFKNIISTSFPFPHCPSDYYCFYSYLSLLLFILLDEIIKEIGRGGFGTVSIVSKKYFEKSKTTGKEKGKEEENYYAMKEMNLNKNNNNEYETILMEINACYVIKHENMSNIVKYVDHYYDSRKEVICLILELCEYGSLSRIINIFKEKHPNEHIPEEVLYFFFS
jgi:hypothetical protein